MSMEQLKIRGFSDTHFAEMTKLGISPDIVCKLIVRYWQSGPIAAMVVKDLIDEVLAAKLIPTSGRTIL